MLGAVGGVEALWEDDELCAVLGGFQNFGTGIVEVYPLVVACSS